MIEGDRQGLTALADELRSIARVDDGGHQHIQYFPDRYYLAAGSLAMAVKSFHVGMPTRRPPLKPVGSWLFPPPEPHGRSFEAEFPVSASRRPPTASVDEGPCARHVGRERLAGDRSAVSPVCQRWPYVPVTRAGPSRRARLRTLPQARGRDRR
ncbi:Imm32 family immunity protein [[Kitasatospora] papulosa]|uniref:Imm32 family immunity protein n=1 Tax=[Kitasatospora] papulosa TaxID=1464011 RepID=UPI003F60EA7E